MSNLTETTSSSGTGKLSEASKLCFATEEAVAGNSFFAVRCFCDSSFTIEKITDGIKNFGFDRDELIIGEKTLSHLIDENCFDFFNSYYKNRISRHDTYFFIEVKMQKNARHAICKTNIIYSGVEPVRIECIFIDISEKKQNGKNLKHIFSNLCGNDLCVCQHTIDSDGKLKIDFITENISEYGYSKEQLTASGMSLFDIIHPDDYRIIKKQLSTAGKNGITSFNNTTRILREKNKMMWTLFEVIISSRGGKILSVTTVLHDIDDQKNATKALFDIKRSLTVGLKQSHFIIDVLKLIQVQSDYDEALKIIMKKLAAFATVSSLEFIIPFDKSSDIFTVYHYDNEQQEFKFSSIDIKIFVDQYPNIVDRVLTYGTAYRDAYCVSKNCENEFMNDERAELIYAIRLSTGTGCLILTDNNKNRAWDNDTISLINSICQVVSGLFQRFYTQKELLTAKDILKTVLDNIDAFVFVSEIETQEIIFTNRKFNDIFGGNNNANECIEKMKRQRDQKGTDLYTGIRPLKYEMFCSETNQWLDTTEIFISWHDGKTVRLTTMNDISQKVEYEKMIEQQAFNDHLTNLPNRRMLEKNFNAFIEKAVRENSFGYLLFLDLDNFKNVNDGLGHQYGDALLITISDYLKNIENTFSYRFGGDEFAIIVPSEHKGQIEQIVSSLLERFQSKWHLLDTTYFCTMSMGVAKFPYDGTSLFDIMKKVDMAMYSAKKSGKNRVMYYKSKIGFDSIRNIEMERYLRESVTNSFHGFSAYYQPIINTKTKELVGAEALARWNCENLGMIPPSEFIPMAENLGLIVDIGDFMLKKACSDCKRWISAGYPDFIMNVNLSVDQLVQPDIVGHIRKIIEETGVPFKNITLEVTESIAVNDMKKMIVILRSLSDMGIHISLDDFGTGYSSLNNIKEMPLNTIKIDKSFIDDLLKNTSTELFVSTIINLAHGLNMKVCAEGVEQEVQYNRLAELNADVIQGYFFGKPTPAEEFEKRYNIK